MIKQCAVTTAAEQRALIEHSGAHTTITDAIWALGCRPLNQAERSNLVLLNTEHAEQRSTYAALWRTACELAAGLAACGVGKGDRVILMLPTDQDYMQTLCAALLLGAVPCSVASPAARDPMASRSYLETLVQRFTPTLVVVPAELQATLQVVAGAPAASTVHPQQLVGYGCLHPDSWPHMQPSDPAHIQLTSGSLSAPKGVLLTQQQVVSNIRAIAKATHFAPYSDGFFVWLPLYHDMGFMQMLTALYYQSLLGLMSPLRFLRRPLAWLQHISDYGITHSGAPTFAYQHCVKKFDPVQADRLDLRSWRHAFIGAEPVSSQVTSAFQRCFAPYGLAEHTLRPAYGMAETVVATTLHQHERPTYCIPDRINIRAAREEQRALPVANPTEPAIEVLSMGQPLEGLEVCVQGPNGHLLADRMIGEICVRGTSLMSGYFRDAEATAQALRGGWYHTGDRGYMVAGEVYVLGRIKELIIVRGRNYLPHDIEQVVEQHPDVRSGYTVAFSCHSASAGTDNLIVIAETKVPAAAHSVIVQALQQALQQRFGLRAHEILLVPHGSIPRTTSGKRQRMLSRSWYQSGVWSEHMI